MTILDPVGCHTTALQKDTCHHGTGHYFAMRTLQSFARWRNGNKAQAFIRGREYMAEVAKALRNAQKFILIADWQLDFDVELDNRGDPAHPGRLSEILANLVRQRNVDIRILLYDSIEIATYTHENEAKARLESLNGLGPGKIQVLLQRAETGREGGQNIAFSHHQKFVIVDGEQAFLGGLDLANGRWDDGNFDVVCDPNIHVINDHYNPCLGKCRPMTAKEMRLTLPNLGNTDVADRGRQSRLLGGPDTVPGEPKKETPGFAPPYQSNLVITLDRIRRLWDEGHPLEEILDYIKTVNPNVEDDIAAAMVGMAVPSYKTAKQIIQGIENTLKTIEQNLKTADHLFRSAKVEIYRAQDELRNGELKKSGTSVLNAYNEAFKIVHGEFKRIVNKKIKDVQDSLLTAQKMYGFATSEKEREKALIEANRKLDQAIKKFDELYTWVKTPMDRSQLLLEPGLQPRMPWQDVHCKITGPAVFDVFKNFVRRWNVALKQSGRIAAAAHATYQGVSAVGNKYFENKQQAHEKKQKGIRATITPLTDAWLNAQGGKGVLFGDILKPGTTGNMQIQILRSASKKMNQLEFEQFSVLDTYDYPPNSKNRALEETSLKKRATEDTVTVQDAMLECISNAKAYIYIENQFFISDCGWSDCPPFDPMEGKEKLKTGLEIGKKASNAVGKRAGGVVKTATDKISETIDEALEFKRGEPCTDIHNKFIEALVLRIADAIVTGTDFHVYMVFPVHPEGMISDMVVSKQLYWQQQGLLRGEHSLIRGVCRHILAKEKNIRPQAVREAELQACVDSDRWRKYLTILNLRSFGVVAHFQRHGLKPDGTPVNGLNEDRTLKEDTYRSIPNFGEPDTSKPLGQYLVTEQVYVHSKLMIVDDKVAIIGSANINDRSLAGNGDSELAAVIHDLDGEQCDLGNKIMVHTGNFARELRIALWHKHLGMDIRPIEEKGRKAYYQPIDLNFPPPREKIEPLADSDILRPAAKATYEKIQEIARGNAACYVRVFTNVPTDGMGYYTDILRGFPKNAKNKPVLNSTPPALQSTYMHPDGTHDIASAMKAMKELKGFWVTMPLRWGHKQRDPAPLLPQFMIADYTPSCPTPETAVAHNAHTSEESAV